MKKHSRDKSSQCIHLENSHPGCMWGILHILNYQRWRYVKKRLPHRRHGSAKHSTGPANSGNGIITDQSDRLQNETNAESEKSVADPKGSLAVTSNKISVKSRLKALITEDRSRRKGRHQRSSTYPVQSAAIPSPDSVQQYESCDQQTLDQAVALINEVSPKSIHNKTESSGSHSEDPATSDSSTTDQVHNDQSDDNEQSTDEHTRSNSKEKGLNVDVPFYESRELLDALSLININEALLKTILRERGPFSPQDLHDRKLFDPRDFQRSGSFPLPGSLGRRDGKSDEKIDTNDNNTHERDGSSDTFAPVIVPRLKDQANNPMAIKRFKDIKQKLKHVTKTDKKEKQRIAMDGVLHKIPKDQGISDEMKREMIQKWRDCALNKDHVGPTYLHSPRKGGRKTFKRTSSLDESMDKYCQLFESSFHREPKQGISDGSKAGGHERIVLNEVAKKSLARILSLPDLESYSFRSEDSSDALPSGVQSRGDWNDNGSRVNSFDGRNCPELNLGFRFQLQLDAYIESEIKDGKVEDMESLAVPNAEENAELSLASVDLRDLAVEDSIFGHDQATETTAQPSPMTALNLNSHSQDDRDDSTELSTTKDLEQQSGNVEVEAPGDSTAITGKEGSNDLGNSEIMKDQIGADSSRVIRVQSKDVELFNYVRDVLELSGFTSSESLGMWHSDGQPMDPSVYNEVEGQSLHTDPECFENYEDGVHYHLRIFDLINEVLIDIYQNSFSYWPRPLTKQCTVHPMPFGYHVLEEVWAKISSYLSLKPEYDPTLDNVVGMDLEKSYWWMNLQFEGECVGLELEDLIFDDLMEELI